MKNEFEIRGETTAIFVKCKGVLMESLIDTADLPKANSFLGTWCVMKNCGLLYVYGVPRNQNGKQITVRLHRLITNCPKDKCVDHINHNTLDNRRVNLRILTKAQNMQNLRVDRVNNKSGYRGVCWHKRDQKWYASVRVGGRIKYLGAFDDVTVAAQVAADARKQHYPFTNN